MPGAANIKDSTDAGSQTRKLASPHTLMKGMERMAVCRVRGKNYPIMPDPTATRDFEKHFRLMRDITLRNDDVITVGIGRSGNNWAFETVHMVQNQTTAYTDRQFHKALMETMGDNIQNTIDSWSSPRHLCMHSYIYNLPRQVIEKRLKIIYVIRNPKDVMTSRFKIMSDFKEPHLKFTGTWDDYFKAEMAGETLDGSWIDHVLATEQFMREHPECPVYIRSYEYALEEPVQAVRELCNFLEKPGLLAEQIAGAVSFGEMKKGTAEKMADFTKCYLEDGASGIVDKGGVGAWKKWFTVTQSEEFDRMFEEKLGDTSIGKFVRKYI